MEVRAVIILIGQERAANKAIVPFDWSCQVGAEEWIVQTDSGE